MTEIEKQFKRIKEEEEKRRFRDEPLPIVVILKDIDSDSLVIPEFQRNFVWDMDKIALLFDSIFKGYTIGNLLFWKTTEKLAHKKVGDKDAIPIERIENKEYTYVLDGQQRLTSLYAVLRGEKVYKGSNKKASQQRIFFDVDTGQFIKYTAKLEEFGGKTLKKLERKGELDKFRFIDLSQIFDEKLNFPNNLIGSEREKIKGELNNTKDINLFNQKDSELQRKKDILEKFAKVLRTYTIPQFVDRDKNIDRVVTIFERINTQNVKLDIFDIMVAKTYQNVSFNNAQHTFNLKKAVKKIKYIKEFDKEKLKPDSDLPDDDNLYYKIDNTTLLRLISIFLGKYYNNRVALQKKDIYELKAQQIQNNIIKMRTVLNRIHRYFKNELNINTVDEKYTDNKILSFLTYVFTNSDYTQENSEILNKWFWNSLIFNRFPGAQLQLIEKDIDAYRKGKDHHFLEYIKIRRNLVITNKDQKLDDFEFIDAGYNKMNNNIYLSSILLLNSFKPKDFNGKDEINLSEYIGSETKSNKHHIIPYNSNAAKELRKKYGKEKANFMLNNIANICIISSSLNRSISGKDPKDYFKKFESLSEFKENLSKHLIDESMYQDLKNEEYESFLKKRTQKLIQSIKEKCRINGESLNLQGDDSGEEA